MNHATYLREKLEINLKNYTINFYTRRKMLTLIKVEYRQGEGIFHRQPYNKPPRLALLAALESSARVQSNASSGSLVLRLNEKRRNERKLPENKLTI